MAGEQSHCASLVPRRFYSPVFLVTIINNSMFHFIFINKLFLFECIRLTFPILCPLGLGGEQVAVCSVAAAVRSCWLGFKHHDSSFPCAEKLSHLETTGVLAFYCMEKGEGT